MIIALMGFMGCGKSSVGRAVAQRLGRRFVDLDDTVTERAGASVQQIFEREGEETFRRYELAALEDLLHNFENKKPTASGLILALGGGTPTIPEAARLLEEKAYVIYLSASRETLISHLQGEAPACRETLISQLQNEISIRPLLRDGGIEKLTSLLQQREGIYSKLSDHTITVDNLSMEDVVEKVLACLSPQSCSE